MPPNEGPPGDGGKIRLAGVGKRFATRGQDIEALRPIDLTVGAQEFVALVGPSGCGKSTILNLIAGLLPPSSGEVIYDGTPVGGLNRQVGYMTQKDTLMPWRSAADNIRLALELKCRAVPRREAAERVAQMIELVGLAGFETHFPAELSGGMRKRVALARTLIYEPETLLMDEPFGALDAQTREILQGELLDIHARTKKTILFVTHDLDEAVLLADRVVVMQHGRLQEIVTVPLPRPRHDLAKLRGSEQFARMRYHIWRALHAGAPTVH
jgi:NitT/TauT family transport system ATP-binding protein